MADHQPRKYYGKLIAFLKRKTKTIYNVINSNRFSSSYSGIVRRLQRLFPVSEADIYSTIKNVTSSPVPPEVKNLQVQICCANYKSPEIRAKYTESPATCPLCPQVGSFYHTFASCRVTRFLNIVTRQALIASNWPPLELNEKNFLLALPRRMSPDKPKNKGKVAAIMNMNYFRHILNLNPAITKIKSLLLKLFQQFHTWSEKVFHLNGYDCYPEFLVRGDLHSIQIDFYDTAPSPLSIPRIMVDSNNELIQNTKKLDLLVTELLPDRDLLPPQVGPLTPSLKLLRALATALRNVNFHEYTDFLSYRESED